MPLTQCGTAFARKAPPKKWDRSAGHAISGGLRDGSIDAAYACAVDFSNKAREAICTFADSEIKRVLLWVPEFVVQRES